MTNEGQNDVMTQSQKYIPPYMRNRASTSLRTFSSTPNFEKDIRRDRFVPPQTTRPPISDRFNFTMEDRNRSAEGFSRRSHSFTNLSRMEDFYSKPFTYWDKRNEMLEAEVFGQGIQSGINFDKYDDIPVESTGENIPPPINDFESINPSLPLILQSNIKLAHFSKPTPVQKHAISIVCNGRDLMACAQTGSGKTAAFVFPLLAILLQKGVRDPIPSSLPTMTQNEYFENKRKAFPMALILAPTRELATQIFEEARKYCYRTNIRSVVVYGGQHVSIQQREIELGVDILVATPGRLVDFVDRGRVSLSNISFLVLDEADRMLDMGFEPQIRKIVEHNDMRKNTERQTLMFSATFPREIQKLAADFLNNYIYLAVGRVGSTTDCITQKLQYVEDREKPQVLFHLLPNCEGLTLIFVATKKDADILEEVLIREGINTAAIHGDRTQREREMALGAFRSGRCPVLVATDVAARGLDIPNVLNVINYDLPSNIDDYVHRIGRTGRCGNPGTALAFYNDKNNNIFKDMYELLKETNQEIPTWFADQAKYLKYDNYFRSRGGRRGGRSRFGGRDYRDRYRNQNNYSEEDAYNNDNYSTPTPDRPMKVPSRDAW